MAKGKPRIIILLFFLLVIYSLPLHGPVRASQPPDTVFESIFRQHGAVMLLIDPDSGDIVFANEAASQYYGYPAETLQTMLIGQINTLSGAEIDTEMQKASLEERNYFQFKHRLADGQIRDVAVYSYPVEVSGRQLLFSVIFDITDKLAAEEQIRRSNQLRQLVLLVIIVFTLAGLIVLAVVNRQRKKAIHAVNSLFRMQKIVADLSHLFITSDPNDLERLFQEALNRCGPLLEIDRSCISLISDDRKSGINRLAWHRPDLAGQTCPDVLPFSQIPWIAGQVLDRRMTHIDDIACLSPAAVQDQAYLQKEGTRGTCIIPISIADTVVAVWKLDTHAKPLLCQKADLNLLSAMAGLFAAALDRQRSHEQQIFWQNLLGYVIEHNPHSIAVLDKEMNYMYASQKFYKDYRISDQNIIGKNHYHLFPNLPEQFKIVHRKVLAGEVVYSEEERFPHADGSMDYTRYLLRPWYQHDGSIGGIVLYLEVITERKRQEQKQIEDLTRYRQQQKLESIGTLASGVAHEINNPIMGIINYAQLIHDESQDPTIRKYASEIIHEGERVSGITHDLLYFSRQQKQSHSFANINDIIQRTLSLVSSMMKKDRIEFQMQLMPDLPPLKCRSQQIQQVLMNLLTNARDALNEKYPRGDPNKIVSLSTGLFEEGGRKWMRITVEDRGNGIPAKIRESLFDPFFTTKPREIGTGLGLPISFGIAREHHGRLTYESEEGRFTRFHLELPVDNGWEIEEHSI